MIAVLSDIHGNLHALDAVLKDMPAVSEIWVLGDMVGGWIYPCEVLDRLLNLSVPVTAVRGNWENGLIEGKNGIHPDWWDSERYTTSAWTVDALKPHHWDYIEKLENTAICDSVRGGAMLFHGRPDNFKTDVVGIFKQDDAAQYMAEYEQKWLLGGHIHRTRLYRDKDKRLAIVGSIGLNFDGIGGTACYALLDEDIVFRHVSYDIESAVKEMENSELYERDFAFIRANCLSALHGRNYIMSLLTFGNSYDGSWSEAGKAWDQSEWTKDRLL